MFVSLDCILQLKEYNHVVQHNDRDHNSTFTIMTTANHLDKVAYMNTRLFERLQSVST